VSSIQKVADLGSINAVLISHYHYDHCCDIGPLQYARQIKTLLGEINTSLPIYAPEGEFFNLLKWEDYTYGVSYNESSVLNIGPFLIIFIKDIYSFFIYSVNIICDGKVLSFSSYTSYFDELAYFFRGSHLLIA